MFVIAQNATGFMIKLLTKYTLFGQEFYLTSTHCAMIITTVVLLGFFIAANISIRKALNNDTVEKPGGFLNVVELIVEKLDGIVVDSMGGEHAKKFRNYIGTLFIFILFNNICGIFGLRAPTADYGVTLCLGLITFFILHFNGIKKNGIKHFTNMCSPVILTPINIISEIATPLSLSLRLFGNVMSGTVMLGLWYGLMPLVFTLGIPAALHCYFDLFSGAIQAYVFCMLTMVYVEDKIAD